MEDGLAGVELSAVAHRAGVGKSTVYRRWGTVPALVADLLLDMAETSLPRADTGTVSGDLMASAHLIRKTFTDPRQGRLFKAIIAAASCDTQTAEALAGFYDTRVRDLAQVIADGITRGEIPPGTDAADVIRYLSAPLYYQFLTSTRRLTRHDADRAVAAVLAAARAGVFVG
ncbi:MAG: TetR family transcriptional regulator [Mycobacterium sp.]|nr:TetR family transcriptional regulator [Mycobacterium sp.]